jgi:hypothetical protein
VRLDAHQHRSAAEEDLVQAQAHDQAAAGAVERRQHPACPPGGALDPAPQRGAAWATARGQEDSQQGQGLAQAQAHGRGGDGELPLLDLGGLQRLLQPVPELAVLGPEGLDFGAQFGARGAGVLGVGDGLLDLVGVLVGGLAATAGLVGLLGDGAVVAKENGGGVADPGEDR